MVRHLLGAFEKAAMLQIGGNSGAAEGVVDDGCFSGPPPLPAVMAHAAMRCLGAILLASEDQHTTLSRLLANIHRALWL